MNLISLNNVSFRYGSHLILDGANLSIEAGDLLALVGYNGCGKTSLLKMLAGINTPDFGFVEKFRGIKIAYLPQEVPTDLSGSVFNVVALGLKETGVLISRYKKLLPLIEQAHDVEIQKEFDKILHDLNESNAWKSEVKINETIQKLGLDPNLNVEDLSAGLKRRVLLGKEIISDPDLLLLDEPTNHLDIDSVVWLEKFLKESGKTLVMVSHDRTFLQNLATRVVEVDRGKLISFDCDFETFIVRRDEYLRAQEQNDAIFDKKLAQEEAWLRQGIKARRTRNEGRVRELHRLREIRRARRDRKGQISFQLQDASTSGQKVMEVEDISVSFSGRPIIKNFTTTIYRGDKIGIIGPNGAGKTTLLNALLGKIKLDSGSVELGTNLQIAYFDQLRETLNLKMSLFEFLGEGSDFVETYGQKQNVMSYLQSFLFSPEQIHGEIGMLSGGEKNRLMLAKLFTRPANVLVLDEPTNDLDMQTMEMLESVLVSFDGTILLVSHDRSFLNNIVTGVFGFEENGAIKELVGGYSEWEAYRALKTKPIDISPKPAEKKAAPKKVEKFTNKERMELDEIPQKIAALEAEQKALEEKLQNEDFLRNNVKELPMINERLTEIAGEEEVLFERWSYLEERRILLETK